MEENDIKYFAWGWQQFSVIFTIEISHKILMASVCCEGCFLEAQILQMEVKLKPTHRVCG